MIEINLLPFFLKVSYIILDICPGSIGVNYCLVVFQKFHAFVLLRQHTTIYVAFEKFQSCCFFRCRPSFSLDRFSLSLLICVKQYIKSTLLVSLSYTFHNVVHRWYATSQIIYLLLYLLIILLDWQLWLAIKLKKWSNI
jgi:hypothetical protein